METLDERSTVLGQPAGETRAPPTHPPQTREYPVFEGSDPTDTLNPSPNIPPETFNEMPPKIYDATDEMDNCDRLFKPVFDFRRKHPSNFIFAHVNVNSMCHKFASLQEILSKNCLDYFAVSETKLDGSFPNAQFSVKGFNLFREDNQAIIWTNDG